jgi:hypothetical protein
MEVETFKDDIAWRIGSLPPQERLACPYISDV